MIRRMETGRTRFAAAVTCGFVVACGLGMLRHEMWRDELQAWLLAAQSRSLPELFHNLRYEGHPALWHLLLFAVSRVTGALWAVQVLHLAIAAAAVFLFARNAPFSRRVRALFAFGYFPLFEYGVISRSYSLGLLLVLSFASLAPRRMDPKGRSRGYLPLGIILALLANANAYGWLLAAALAGGLAVEALTRTEVRQAVSARMGEALVSLGIWAVAAALGVFQMLPPEDGGFAARSSWSWAWDPQKLLLTLSSVAQAYFPLPNVGAPAVWNSLLLWRLPIQASVLLGVAAVAGLAWSLRRSRLALAAYLGGTLALLAFSYIFYFGWLRHHGHHFVLAIGCLWLARADQEGGAAAAAGPRRDLLPVLWLTAQMIAGVTLWGLDLVLPFSNARAVARLLQDVPLPVAVTPSYLGTPVSGYLGRPFLRLDTLQPVTFVLWNADWTRSFDPQALCGQLGKLARSDPRGAVWVTAFRPPPCAVRMRLVASFGQSLEAEERYLVFQVAPPAGP
jgi:hypothetical protein